MKRVLRRVAWGFVGLAVLLVTVEAIETYTANREREAFFLRTGSIDEGMTETEVRAVAGAPDKFVTGLGSTTDSDAVGASCRETRGTAAMLYPFENCGWMCEQLGLSSTGTSRYVVCLDDRRIVVKTYLEMIKF